MEVLRPAGGNERRCIVRQALDYYRTLIIAAEYNISATTDTPLKSTLIKALKHCISVHPILSAVIIGEETESPAFGRPPVLQLDRHFQFVNLETYAGQSCSSQQDLLKSVFIRAHDEAFHSRDKIPPWKIIVGPLPGGCTKEQNSFLITFAYYHSHGDGKSGLVFHKTFLEGLELASGSTCPYNDELRVSTPNTPLVPPIETAGKLYISWSYLLGPLLGVYLPKFMSQYLQLRASATPEAEKFWCGKHTFHDSNDFHTGVEIVTISHEKVQKILARCREHRAKITSLLHQLIVRGLSRALPVDHSTADCFVSQTAIDLRRCLTQISDNDMALCPSGYYETFPRDDPKQWTGWATAGDDNTIWTAARATTEALAKCAGTLTDQPIGLLAYLRNFYPWMTGQLGKRRDCSYELSNLLSFDSGSSKTWRMGSVYFSQPANATGGCLSFNVVSRKGGDMVIILSWQMGALDVEDEQKFASRVCDSISSSFDVLASS